MGRVMAMLTSMDFAPEPQPLHIPLATGTAQSSGAAQSPGAAKSPGLPERLHASPGRRADSQIEGHLRLPESPRAVLTIHPATATPERFYSGFADFAAARGLAVVTYGYRGVGSSTTARANRDVRMSDWMSEDVDAVAEWTAQRFPALPQVALGHSLGGHALVLGHGTARLSGIVTIASHRAATRDISPLSERLRVHAILSLFGPGLSSLVGFAPGRRLGLGENIPTAAMRQWSRWSRLPDYFFDEKSLGAAARMARMPVPVLAAGVTDDPWASVEQIDALVERLLSAEVTRRTFTPADLGMAKVGHHGLMRRRVGEAAWPEIVDWLLTVSARRTANR